MAKRVVTKIGDIFSVRLDDTHKKYFQYIANDLTQLNSDVIRCFSEKVPLDIDLEPSTIVLGNVEFHAHCITSLGVKLGCWEKIGHLKIELSSLNILFRDSNDYGNPNVKKSKDWYIWKINEGTEQVGELGERNQSVDIGIIVTPSDIVHFMRTGSYPFIYPEY